MDRQLRLEYEGAFYHVTARGNERRKIYFSEYDYQKFREYLGTAQDKYVLSLRIIDPERLNKTNPLSR